MFVGEVDETARTLVKYVLSEFPIGQQSVVGPSEEEFVELRSRHQATDGGAKRVRTPLGCRVLGIRGDATREDEGRAAQGLAGRGHRHRVEQRLRSERRA